MINDCKNTVLEHKMQIAYIFHLYNIDISTKKIRAIALKLIHIDTENTCTLPSPLQLCYFSACGYS